MNERKMQIYKKLHILSLMIGMFSIVCPVIFWSKIPERIPMHYNAAGKIDNWGEKSTLILLFFVVVLMMGMMSIVIYVVKSSMDSRYSTTQEKSVMPMVYQVMVFMNLMMQVMFAYVMFCCASCRELGIFFLPVFLAGIFLPMVYMIVKYRRLRENSDADRALFKRLEAEETGIIYRSAVDWWLAIILGGTEVMVLWFALEPIIRSGEISWGVVLTALGVTILLLPLGFVKYVMSSKHLLISMGLYGRLRVRYADITTMKKTGNPLSSAALSLRRIQIDYVENGVHQMVLISPKNRDAFMKEVEKRKERENRV